MCLLGISWLNCLNILQGASYYDSSQELICMGAQALTIVSAEYADHASYLIIHTAWGICVITPAVFVGYYSQGTGILKFYI